MRNANKALGWAGVAVALIVTTSYFWNWDLAKHGYYLLTALGFVAILVNWRRVRVDCEEGWFFIAAMLFFATALVSNWVNGLPPGGYAHIESHYGKLLSVIPLFYLFRYARLPQERIWVVFATGAFSAGTVAIAHSWFPEVSGVWIIDEFEPTGRASEDTDFGPPGRASGNANAIMFAIVTLGMTVASLTGVIYARRWKLLGRGFLVLSSAMGILAIILAETRAVWVALPVLLFLVFGIYRRHLGRHQGSVLMLGVALFVAAYQMPIVENRIDRAFTELILYLEADDPRGAGVSTSVGIHLEIWRAAARLFMQHPVFGVGTVGFEAAIDKMAHSGAFHPDIRRHHFHPHSQYLAALAFWGLCGFISLMLLLVYSAWLFFRRVSDGPRHIRGLALAGLLIVGGYMFCGLTDVPLEQKTTILFYGLATAMLYGGVKAHEGDALSSFAAAQKVEYGGS